MLTTDLVLGLWLLLTIDVAGVDVVGATVAVVDDVVVIGFSEGFVVVVIGA